MDKVSGQIESSGAGWTANEWLDALLESVPLEIWAADRDGRCVLQNAASRARVGELRGLRLAGVAAVVERSPGLPAAMGRAFTGELVRNELVDAIGGAPRRGLRLVGPLSRGEERVGVFGVELDITEARADDEQRQRAQRLEALGLLAGGIAHDFNNLLMAVVGHISLSRVHQRTGVPADALLDEAERACLRAQALTQQLLTFARAGQATRELVQLADLVRESARFAASGSTCRCEFHLADDLMPVLADLGQLHQVITNLVQNAVQAMPQGGTVTLAARNVALAHERGPLLPAGRYVTVSVRDHGVGIPRALLARVFDPYVTASPVGHGLGLAVAYSIVHRHQGTIEIESEEGAGTTVTVYLPAADGERPARPTVDLAVPHGSGPVLVLDDEAAVRSVTAIMLKSLGYTPLSAASCFEAVAICTRAREEGRRLRLAIIDLTMPGGPGGRECLRRLLEVDPELKAVVASGYTNDPVLAEYREHGFADVLTKPFSREHLAITLDRLLVPDPAPPLS